MLRLSIPLLAFLLSSMLLPNLFAAESNFTHQEDIIYGRKYGTALRVDVFTPKERRSGAAVVLVVSRGWFSSHESINLPFAQVLLVRGYTVFAVVHGSQPKFTMPEAIADLH